MSTPNDSANRTIDALIAAYMQALEAGETPDRQALLADHPEQAEELNAFFADLDRMDRVASPLRLAVDRDATHDFTGNGSAPPTTVRYFGDYEIQDEIGRGGMGIVYKARQVSLNRQVAIKMILTGKLASAREVQRFRSEAESAANLDHPHIVPIFEVGEHDEQQYYTMKFIEGASLANLPRGDARGEVTGLLGVIRAVHHAHQRGMLHRDLKPSNVLVDSTGTRLVTDFGLAKRLSSNDGTLTEPGLILGTPRYMAPEQAAGRKDLTVAADIYSLGVILYERLTGQTPFVGDTPLSLMRQARETPAPRPSSIQANLDRDLETIVLKCLEKDPERRYSSAEALSDDLARWLRGEPILARPVGRFEKAWRWCKRNRAIAALAGGLAASLLLGTIASSMLALSERSQRFRAESAENEALEQQDQSKSLLVTSLIGTLGEGTEQESRLTPSQTDALSLVARESFEGLRQRFLNEGISDSTKLRKLRHRSEAALIAAVGLDLERWGHARRLLHERFIQLGQLGGRHQRTTDSSARHLPEAANEEAAGSSHVGQASDSTLLERANVAFLILELAAAPEGTSPYSDAIADAIENLESIDISDELLSHILNLSDDMGALQAEARNPWSDELPSARFRSRIPPLPAARVNLAGLSRSLKRRHVGIDPYLSAYFSLAIASNCKALQAPEGHQLRLQAIMALTTSLSSFHFEPESDHMLDFMLYGQNIALLCEGLDPNEADKVCAPLVRRYVDAISSYPEVEKNESSLKMTTRPLALLASMMTPEHAIPLLKGLPYASRSPSIKRALARHLISRSGKGLEPASSALLLEWGYDQQHVEWVVKTAVGSQITESRRMCSELAPKLLALCKEISSSEERGFLAQQLATLRDRLDERQTGECSREASAVLVQILEKDGLETSRSVIEGLLQLRAVVPDSLKQRLREKLVAQVNETRQATDAQSRNPVSFALMCRLIGTESTGDILLRKLENASSERKPSPKSWSGTLSLADALRQSSTKVDPLRLRMIANNCFQCMMATDEADYDLSECSSVLFALASKLPEEDSTLLAYEAISFLFELRHKNVRLLVPGSLNYEYQIRQIDFSIALLLGLLAERQRNAYAYELCGLICNEARGEAPAGLSRRTVPPADLLDELMTSMGRTSLSAGPDTRSGAAGYIRIRPRSTSAFSAEELAELLKMPTCVGPLRRRILDRLEMIYGRPFINHWAFVRYAKQAGLKLDFTHASRPTGVQVFMSYPAFP